GVKTTRSAIGARIKLMVENEGQPARFIFRTVGSGGSFGASPLTQHIGLGELARLLDLEIDWRARRTRQNFTQVAPDQFLEIKEFAKQYDKLERHKFRLGGPPGDRKPSAAKDPTP